MIHFYEASPDEARPTKASHNPPSPSSEFGDISSVLSQSEKEDGEWSGKEVDIQEKSFRLFQAGQFQRLMNKIISTLSYQLNVKKPRPQLLSIQIVVVLKNLLESLQSCHSQISLFMF